MRAALGGGSKRKGTGLELSRWTSAPPRREVPALLAAYAEMPWLGTIVDTVGDAFADVMWRAFIRQDPGTRKALVDVSLRRACGDVRRERLKSLVDLGGAAELPDHPLLRLLADPNDFMTGRDFAKLFCLHYDLTGEFFAVLEEVAGVPVGLWPVPP
ncbi:phage portal protein, partial [Myxococcus sp. K15C18031901]